MELAEYSLTVVLTPLVVVEGAVAIRLDYRSTSFCFLTAHLAAGHSNVGEREQDYATIAAGLHFSRGKAISNHENVIWAADTNFRISLSNDEVRTAAEQDDYDTLYASDQVRSPARRPSLCCAHRFLPSFSSSLSAFFFVS